jgi:hypothetical protein
MASIETMISELNAVAGIFEVHHISSFKCYRTGADGESQEVLVEIKDQGPAVKNRYSCRATTPDGKTATGNPGPTIPDMLSIVHWQELGL